MNIVYFVHWNTSQLDGVLKKIRGQITEWKREGQNVTWIIMSPAFSNVLDPTEAKVFFYRNFIERLFVLWKISRLIASLAPDLIYTRLDQIGRAHV